MDNRTQSFSPIPSLRFHFPVFPRLANRLPTLAPLFWLACLLSAALLLAACGPAESKADTGKLEAETKSIAQRYQADNELGAARTALDALDVANSRQWLVLVTEQSIGAKDDPQITEALVKLTDALGIQSVAISDYAAKNGLADPTPTFVPVAPVMAQAPASVATTAPVAAAMADTGAAPAALVTSTTPATDTTSVGQIALALATVTPVTSGGPVVAASDLINVRSGPGIEYDIVAALQPDEQAPIVGKSPAGDWWEVRLANGQSGWVLGQLVQANGDLAAVVVESNIPEAPPTATPAPTVQAEPVVAQTAPTAEAAATEAATAAPTAAASPSDKPFFTLVERRMWGKAENGDCIGQHLLRIHVLDANGAPLNGIRLKGIYTGAIFVTGDQGKGDGVIEYDLYGTGEGFMVILNNDGREAGSDHAEGFTTQSRDIDVPTLIAGGYCSDEADCQVFYSSWGCNGHHSWEATFKRNY